MQSDLKSEHWTDRLQAMTNCLVHRGPDDVGYWHDARIGVGFGHRRLSILDLSPLGRQPMTSASGRFRITYNGEVYNFRELRAELQHLGHVFRSQSDTEVILASIEQWGIERAINRFVGMFAFALWDESEQMLHLVRDRLGIKPLYYGVIGEASAFSSELKAFTVHPAFERRIDRDALALFFRHGYIPAPYSIYEGIRKLPPGTILSLSPTDNKSLPSPYAYWSFHNVAVSAQRRPFQGSEMDAVHQLDSLLRDAIQIRLIADVPVGAFLSGGIDSSLVVALMQAQSTRAVRTFSIGFQEQEYNEAPYARAVAKHLGTDHTELYVTPDEAKSVIPDLPTLYDEPFSDSSQIPTYLVSRLARQHVTVSLSGDGGDELFGGYERYFWAQDIWQKISWMPGGLKHGAAKVLAALSAEQWDTVLRKFELILPGKTDQRFSGDRILKFAEIVNADRVEALNFGLLSIWKSPESLVRGAHEPLTVFTNPAKWADFHDPIHRMMFLDTLSYLPDDILVKVDRASMGVGLEARVPLLDHRVVEFAWQLPISLKSMNGQSKWLMRQVLDQYVPRVLTERPKAGFELPIDMWLRSSLRDWAESLLDESRLRQEGLLNPAPIREKWEEHLKGVRNWHFHLWNILMFQAWQETWVH